MAVNITVLGALAAGVVFVYAAVEDQPVLKALQSVIKGQSPPVAVSGGSASGTATSGSTVPEASAPAAPASLPGNVALGKLLAAAYGWSTGTQWDALYALWERESGWDNLIWNGGSTSATEPAGSSGAYGIPQALPYSKMPKAAWPTGYGGSASATSQIEWGLSYIKSVYGTPSAAYSADVANGGY